MSGLRVRDEGAVRVLTFSSPPGNVLSLRTLADLRRETESAAADERVRALLLGSDVDGYFSSGLDLEEQMSLPEARRAEPFEALLSAYRALLSCPKPTVAALSGTAFLGGWIVAMACDWRLAAPGVKIALAEVRAALTPSSALIERLSSLSSDPRVVKELVLRGKSIGAEEACAAALIDEVVSAADLEAAAKAAAKRLAKSPPRAYARIKRSLNAAATDEGLWRRSLEEFAELFGGAEAREGVAALRAKRRPRWESA